MEKAPNTKKNIIEEKKKSVEEHANYEGNHFLLLLERFSNLEIREKLIEDMYQDIKTIDYSEYDYIDSDFLKYINQSEMDLKKDLIKKLEESILQTSKSTEIEYSEKGYLDSNRGDVGMVGILCNDRENIFGDSILTRNIAEAHEKGHVIRMYDNNSEFSEEIRSVFDFNNIYFSEEEYNLIRIIEKNEVKFNNLDRTNEEIRSSLEEYFSYTSEIIERMSQVKNYFGMSGTEEFTMEHLKYAKENYVKDTGIFPPQIRPFFDAIVDNKKFIEKMNTLGI